jgi:hypothetical protein
MPATLEHAGTDRAPTPATAETRFARACGSDGRVAQVVRGGSQYTGSCYAVAVRVRAAVFDVGGVLEVNLATGWPERWAGRLGLTADELGRRLDRLWSGGDVGS